MFNIMWKVKDMKLGDRFFFYGLSDVIFEVVEVAQSLGFPIKLVDSDGDEWNYPEDFSIGEYVHWVERAEVFNNQ